MRLRRFEDRFWTLLGLLWASLMLAFLLLTSGCAGTPRAIEARCPTFYNETGALTNEGKRLHRAAWNHCRTYRIAQFVEFGMPSERYAELMGKPSRINRTITGAGIREQWVYEPGGFLRPPARTRRQYEALRDAVHYAYFVDGRLAALGN